MNFKKLKTLALSLVIIALTGTGALAQSGNTVYNNIPSPLPPNVPSLGFQATQTAEFGDYVIFAGSDRRAASATVTMSDWALHSTYPTMPAAGFNHDITFNIYAVDHSGPTPAVGALLGSVTQTFLIPWRPEPTPTCGTKWLASDNNCYNGLAFKITFDLRSLALTLPNEVIYGVAYNTNTWGYDPIGQPGPYESLNVGLAVVPPTVGTDAETDALFWNTMTPANYTDGGAGGVGIFRRDDNWTPHSPAIEMKAFTVPASRDACKADGWKTLSRADGSPFKNQGDCIQYVNTGK